MSRFTKKNAQRTIRTAKEEEKKINSNNKGREVTFGYDKSG